MHTISNKDKLKIEANNKMVGKMVVVTSGPRSGDRGIVNRVLGPEEVEVCCRGEDFQVDIFDIRSVE